MPDYLVFPSIYLQKLKTRQVQRPENKPPQRQVKKMTIQKMDNAKPKPKVTQPQPTARPFFRNGNDLQAGMIGRIANIRPGCSSCGGAR